MKLILLDNIKNLGNKGSHVKVKAGYARNYLIPQSKAVLDTAQNVDILKKQQDILQSKIKDKQAQSEFFVKAINDIGNITIMVKASVEGKLFGSVGSKVISEAITKSVGFKVFKSQIRLPNNDVLKFVGVYNIAVHIYNEVFSYLNITILNELDHKDNKNLI